MNCYEEILGYKDYLVEHRRYFHQHPELSGEEVNTQRYICNLLDALDIPFTKVAGTGIIATIASGRSGKAVALRGDMDALPIREISSMDYRSCNEGVMHACGHDTHMAMLITAARYLKAHEDELTMEVKLVFQPAEEKMTGAKQVIEDESYDNIECIHGIHVWSELEEGQISVKEGPLMAAVDSFSIRVKGVSAHGAMPEKGVDGILIASHIVTNIQSVVSREMSPLDPVVITIGKIKGGTGVNILAEEVLLEGTLRYFRPELQEIIKEKMTDKVEQIAKAYGGSAELVYNVGLPPVINDSESASILEKAIAKVGGIPTAIEPVTISEDFSILMENRKGAMSFLGIAHGECKPLLHTPDFDVREDVLIKGAALHVQFALDYMENKNK